MGVKSLTNPLRPEREQHTKPMNHHSLVNVLVLKLKEILTAWPPSPCGEG
jgi:hypothetical protein